MSLQPSTDGSSSRALEKVPAAQKREELRAGVRDCRNRGLYQAAKWASEQLAGLPASEDTERQNTLRSQGTALSEDSDSLLLARTLFDAKEYRRAASALKNVGGNASLFLRLYSLYLAGERRKEDERKELAGPLGRADVRNGQLDELEMTLHEACTKMQGSSHRDGFLFYLYGCVLADRERKDEARKILLEACSAYPCNWSAWQALQSLSAPDAQSGMPLPQHWMRDFFLASLCLDLQHNEEALGRLQKLQQAFPESDWVMNQAATAQYNLRNFDEAQALFEELRRRDPDRLEGMDTYSNILYVKEQYVELSHLAHRAAVSEKYRPETCCIIGNYYSLRGHHEKAVTYFRRALKLNPQYLSAWTLMGHEYVEMKSPPAAIEAYRRAVDLNPRDYRAWYGLGQTYELLNMPNYALYYFRRATQLRPSDARMWCAMGQCHEHEQLGQLEAAIRCYHRAVDHNDREGIAVHKLAKLYKQLADTERAAHFYTFHLKRLDEEQSQGQDVAEALEFLATYNKDAGVYDEAEALTARLMDFGGPYRDSAKSLMREIRTARFAKSGMTGMLGM